MAEDDPDKIQKKIHTGKHKGTYAHPASRQKQSRIRRRKQVIPYDQGNQTDASWSDTEGHVLLLLLLSAPRSQSGVKLVCEHVAVGTLSIVIYPNS